MMEKELEQLILNNEYYMLNAEEKASLAEWCANEDEFLQLKQVFMQLEGLTTANTFVPKRETKQSLDDLFAAKHQKSNRVIWLNGLGSVLYSKEKPLYQRPMAYAAAIGIIALLTTPFLFDNTPTKKPALAEAQEKQQKQQKTSTEPNVKQQEAMKEEPKTFIHAEIESDLMFADAEIEHVANDEVYAMESVSVSEIAVAEPAALSRSMADENWTHVDGIRQNTAKEKNKTTASSPVSAHPSVLDLLTATF
jgi:hypothetical protein